MSVVIAKKYNGGVIIGADKRATSFAFAFIFFEKSLDLGANTTPPLTH